MKAEDRFGGTAFLNMLIHVEAVNDPPEITAPSSLAAYFGLPRIVHGISIDDVDDTLKWGAQLEIELSISGRGTLHILSGTQLTDMLSIDDYMVLNTSARAISLIGDGSKNIHLSLVVQNFSFHLGF